MGYQEPNILNYPEGKIMNDEEKQFEEHILKGWRFAQKATEELKINGHITTNVTLVIFEKYLSPYYYFTDKSKVPNEKATEKQIALAKKLEIENPEQYSKKELSKKLSEVLDNES